jgi:hypothetical protein
MLSANLVWAVSRQGKGERGVIYTDMKERTMGRMPERVGLTWPSGLNHVNSTMTSSNVLGFFFFLRHAIY